MADDSFASYSIGIGDLDDSNDLMAHAAAINSLMPAIAAAGTQTNASANAGASATLAAGATNVAVNPNSNVVASDEHNFASVSLLLFLFCIFFVGFPFFAFIFY